MKTSRKIWIGVGSFVMASLHPAAESGAHDAVVVQTHSHRAPVSSAAASQAGFVVAQAIGQGGDGEGGAGGEGGAASLPPDLGFATMIGLVRGHLLVGDQLVKQGQWVAALPHFLHPSEEIYGALSGRLGEYGVPPFEAALKRLAAVVKSRKAGDDYAQAWQQVNAALAAADSGLQAKQPDWGRFTVETALELLKAAGGEYEAALVAGRIAKPVEYQDALGFVWQAERMLDSVSDALASKDAEALAHVRSGLAELKKAFPAPLPPKVPVKDHAAFLADLSRVELAAGRLM